MVDFSTGKGRELRNVVRELCRCMGMHQHCLYQHTQICHLYYRQATWGGKILYLGTSLFKLPSLRIIRNWLDAIRLDGSSHIFGLHPAPHKNVYQLAQYIFYIERCLALSESTYDSNLTSEGRCFCILINAARDLIDEIST